MERKVSAMTSSRVSAAAAASNGPRQTSQEAFICGRAAILLMPLRTKVKMDGSATVKLTGFDGVLTV